MSGQNPEPNEHPITDNPVRNQKNILEDYDLLSTSFDGNALTPVPNVDAKDVNNSVSVDMLEIVKRRKEIGMNMSGQKEQPSTEQTSTANVEQIQQDILVDLFSPTVPTDGNASTADLRDNAADAKLKSEAELLTIDTKKVENRLGTKTMKVTKECDLCIKNSNHNIAEYFCLVCEEHLCQACHEVHMSLKATRNHKVSNIDDLIVHTELCEPCTYRSKDRNAEHFCKDCDEFLCSDCSFKHQQMKLTKHHSVILAKDQIRQESKTKQNCGICIENDEKNEAVAFCLDCYPQELLCSECLNDHAAFKKTRGHRIEHSMDKYHAPDLTISKTISSEQKIRDEIKKPHEDLFKPGKPTLCGTPNADSFTLTWKPPERLYEPCEYLIRYKTTSTSDTWKFYEEKVVGNTVLLRNLKSESTFVCQVRMLNDNDEGPYSAQSDPVSTKTSDSDVFGQRHEQSYRIQSTNHQEPNQLDLEMTQKEEIPVRQNQNGGNGAKANLNKTKTEIMQTDQFRAEELNVDNSYQRDQCDLCNDHFRADDMRRCSECKTNLCEPCANSHKSELHKVSFVHIVEHPDDIYCEPCRHTTHQNKANKRCQVCYEILCDSCALNHQAQKFTRDHQVVDIVVEVKGNSQNDSNCEPCAFKILNVPAVYFCTNCKERLCKLCYNTHTNQKATKGHKIFEIKVCESCLENNEHKIADKYCKDCEEYMCQACHMAHSRFRKTKDHNVCNIDEIPESLFSETCEPCKQLSKIVNATHFCSDCEELLCTNCCDKHQSLRTTKHHSVVLAKDQIRQDKGLQQNCEVCRDTGKSSDAVAFCLDCDTHTFLCSACLNDHRAVKTTRHHKIEYSLDKCQKVDMKRSNDLTNEQRSRDPQETELIKQNPLKPGKPSMDGVAKADSVQLSWTRPKDFNNTHQYQIRYKSNSSDDKWRFYEELFKESTVKLMKLQSNSTFIFQVRAVNNDGEGPYSEESNPITTKTSAANHLVKFSVKSKDDKDGLAKMKLVLEENQKARSTEAKTRKVFLGNPDTICPKERTILLVGATGSGKSTLVDGFINYILAVNWNDPFRFTLVDLENEEEGIRQNQAVSQTQWITTYCINPQDGSKLDYRLNIIDTPGFGDTRGIERDQQIVEQIRRLFSANDEKGVVFLDAVCFITKAPDARLTATQRYIFNAILSLFGQDIADNIHILITFADGKTPPVLAALKEAGLPHEIFFPFNNSGLFADNSGATMSSIASIFWEMGYKSFESFFVHLEKMETKSLQQTKEVLLQRQQMEVTIENLTPLVSSGLNKLDELREEIRILNQHKTEIEANKDFTYTMTVTKHVRKELPKGIHVTNCLHCNVTCHNNCAYANDEDKKRCCVMDSSGNCTQCSDKCNWKQHANTPYIFEYHEEEKQMTYAEMEEKYRNAQGEEMTHEKVVQRMAEELDTLEEDILDLMATITECNNVLKKIALRPNPLSVKEHIDILIESEKQEKRPGFQRRIEVLNNFRKKSITLLGEDITRFRKDLHDTRSHSSFAARKTPKPTEVRKNQGLVGKMKNWFNS